MNRHPNLVVFRGRSRHRIRPSMFFFAGRKGKDVEETVGRENTLYMYNGVRLRVAMLPI